MRSHLMPGLALAGGVLIAALLALLLIGDGGPTGGPAPEPTGPTATRLLPSESTPAPGKKKTRQRGAGKTSAPGAGGGGGAVLGESLRGGSAAESQYVAPDRGTVLPGSG